MRGNGGYSDEGAKGLRRSQREPKLRERWPAFFAKGRRQSAGLGEII